MSPHKGSDDGQASGRTWIMGKEAFERRMPHHDGIKALWETKWKFPVSTEPRRPLSRESSTTTTRGRVAVELPILVMDIERGICSVPRAYIRSTMANSKTLSQFSTI
jgi:hypothetical protein